MQHQSRLLSDGSTALYAWFEAMHTRVDMLLRKKNQAPSSLLDTAEAVRALLFRLEKAGNRFDPDSEISRLVDMPPGIAVKLSDDLYDMLRLAVHYYTVTEGLFDITVNTPGHTPQTMTEMELSETERSCTLHQRGMVLDLSGFIKGYALDRIKPLLEAHGICDTLISMGNSSIMALGDVPGPVKNGVLTTSGNNTALRQHIINPSTGRHVAGQGMAQVRTASGAEGEVMAKVNFIRQNQSTG
ncbi:MAG: FAD:protein FMN transferase [Muribaculaceae bacterium]|nr:FAD:protein FMN transferase [Muribaculaceae bacterium]